MKDSLFCVEADVNRKNMMKGKKKIFNSAIWLKKTAVVTDPVNV